MNTPVSARPARAAADTSPPWSPDQGDGTYRNPVLFADYSDPDAIRVGEDYWLTSSSFGHVPGLPILHSRDLVNWQLVNHALPRLVPDAHFSQPRHGQGVWAPSIRHHAGRFWIFYPDPDFGLYVITADDPRGRWSEPVMVKAGKGLIDPCPFWDEDGTGYLVHGWARSRAGICNLVTLHRLSADSQRVVDEGKTIIDGAQLSGWNTIEGPKLYRRGEYIYVFTPAGGVATGYQAVFRSRSIHGPYESRIVLEQGTTSVNGPHQGAWVDTPEGTHWFLHFQEIPAYGRVVHLQPMRWHDDGWPVMGDDADGDGKGQPVTIHPLPRRLATPRAAPAAADAFAGPRLGLQWQWQANPAPGFHSLLTAPNRLRLPCLPYATEGSLWTAPHLLMQKFPAPEFTASTSLCLAPTQDGDAAGLIVFGYDYAWIGLRRAGGNTRIVFRRCLAADKEGTEEELFSEPFTGRRIELRVSVGAGARCEFAWRAPDQAFRPVTPPFLAKSSRWVGAKVGLFAASVMGSPIGGYADVDWFRVGAGLAR